MLRVGDVVFMRRCKKGVLAPVWRRAQPGRTAERVTFPIAPLEDLLGHPTASQLTRLLRCGGSEVTTARAWGWSWTQADRYATRAGFHPAEVWPDLWWLAARLDAMGAEWEDGAARPGPR